MAINAFSNLTITISDGGTVPSLDYLDIKTYINIGSGNILKMSWNTPTATNNAVDSYIVNVLAYDTSIASYKNLYTANIGNVNEFYLKSSIFDSIDQSFVPVQLYVEAVSLFGTSYNGISNIESVYVSRGAGSYIKVTEGYSQPIMKRALAFVKVAHVPLLDKDGKAILTADGKELYGKASNVQDDTVGWTLMQECFVQGPDAGVLVDANNRTLVDANGAALYAAGIGWQLSDIQYEVLTDSNGDIITDSNNDAIYVL